MSETKKRKVGHYWVKIPEYNWIVAVYTGFGWKMAGFSQTISEKEFSEIDERIIKKEH